MGGCAPVITPDIGNGGVDLGGSVTAPPTNGSPRPGAGGGADRPTTPVIPGCVTDPALCRDGFTITTPTEGRGPITLADLVNFRPTAGVARMEPNGWMVVGLATNFYVDSGVNAHDGLLLGVPASVRFTPVSYRWVYGDGTSATLGTPGSSWAAQGLREFDPTATSHVYRAAGAYDIDVTLSFRAEYTFGGGAWVPIAGTLPIASPRLTAVAGDATTVLVARECTLNPRGPGC